VRIALPGLLLNKLTSELTKKSISLEVWRLRRVGSSNSPKKRLKRVIEHILQSLSASRDRQAIRLMLRHRELASEVGLPNLKRNEILAFRVG
jgi:hypothetical protein